MYIFWLLFLYLFWYYGIKRLGKFFINMMFYYFIDILKIE